MKHDATHHPADPWVGLPNMVKAVPDILAQIIEQKKIKLLQRDPGMEARAFQSVSQRRDFSGALLKHPFAVIAEIKKASPSKGVLVDRFDPSLIARQYEEGGAAALSVLTDATNFQGCLAHLEKARAVVDLPVLRKDFTIDEYHVLEAAAHGADAILLIAAALDGAQLRRFRELAEQFAMAVLVEVHDEDELSLAIDSGAAIIGVNNRDLRTFEVSLDVSRRLAERMPKYAAKVAESGIRSAADIRTLRAAGYQAFLVGEHLMRSPDPAAALRSLYA
jgi:indole-3-glycerol phosphate synthase